MTFDTGLRRRWQDHGPTVATLPLGVEAAVDPDAMTLTIDQPASQ